MKRPPQRRAFTLAEILVVLPAVTIFSGLAIHAWLQLRPVPEMCAEHAQATGALGALAGQFRQDAHFAAEVRLLDNTEPPPDTMLSDWKFVGAGGEAIEFRVEGDALLREIHDGDTLVRHEKFAIPNAKITGLEFPSAGKEKLVSLVVAPVDRPKWRIEAALGLHSFAAK